MKQVHVIGAGFAGLTLALRLAEKGLAVHLYEKSSRVGGLLGTTRTEHGLAEQAANALISTEASERLFKDLGIASLTPLKESKKRFIWRGKPSVFPLKITEVAILLAKLLPRLIFAKENLAPHKNETLEVWGERHLGKAATAYVLEPAMQGIYAAESKMLSSDLILGHLFKAKEKKKKYRGMITGPNGMQDLVDKLEKRLRELGVQIHLNSKVKPEDLSGEVMIATSMKAASETLQIRAPKLASLLANLPMTSLLSATLFFKSAQTKYQGFGCLIPRKAGFTTLGVLFNPTIFAGRDKTYNETWILAGTKELFQKDDCETLKLIAEERFRLFGFKDNLADFHLHRWQEALPLYGLALEKALTEVPALEQEAGIRLHGNYLGGIGLSKILERSETLANEIAESTSKEISK
jgi:oxygen-dependent protoporphyrinogen oxidase